MRFLIILLIIFAAAPSAAEPKDPCANTPGQGGRCA